MPLRVGIIGAGIAGLTLATRLVEAGHEVKLLDKGRGVGGRTSTRRGDPAAFDHGAQYFTVRDPRFRTFLDEHLPPEVRQRWEGRFARLEQGELLDENRLDPRYVGVPGMNAIARALATKLDAQTDGRVVRLSGQPGRWILSVANGYDPGPLDWVVSTAPPTQTAALFEGISPIATTIGQVRMRPCFTLMIAPADGAELPFDGIRAKHPVLGWLANNHSKPGREPIPALVIQSSPEWAEARIDAQPIDVIQSLKQATAECFGIDLEAPTFESVHRWLYAQPVEPLGSEFVIDPQARIAACGDWCLSGKVEGAFLSGLALAEEFIRRSQD